MGKLRAAKAIAAAGLAVVATCSVGCSTDSIIAAAGVPGTKLAADISDVSVRYDYLDAFVSAGGFRYRLFFPDSEPCRLLLNDPGSAHFVWLGHGRLTRGDQECSAVGTLSLKAWRDRGPRRSREPLTRAQAVFEEVWRDAEMVIVRGRFPLAGLVNWVGGPDSIAIIPNSADCRGFLEKGVASMEFRASGMHPLVLLDKSRLCTITGFAQPPPFQ